MTDAQLIHSYLHGDEKAFEQLYSRYRRQVYSYLNKMLPGQGATVDDLYQKTWLKVIDNLDRYHDDKRFIAYILRIARNQAIDHFRKARREVAVEPQVMSAFSSVTESPAAPLENREIAAAIDRALENLPSEQKEVFLMRRQDMAFKEIASVQGVSINTVLGRMRYAMTNLKNSLVEAGVTR